MAVVACLLCVGIFALCINTPEAQRLNADDIAQKKAEIDRAESLVKELAEALHNQSAINRNLTEADNRTITVIENLQSSIARLGEHVKDSVPTREEVTKLVSAKVEASTSDGECTCGEKLADLQRQIDDLKAKVASLECLPSRTSSSAAAASSYGSVSSPVVVSSGGSTGSVKSGGSTGSVVRSSYGSTGSAVQYSQPVYSQPVYSQPVVVEYSTSTPVVVSESVSDGCYVDANGNTVCPQRAAQPRSQGLMPRLRSRFGN